MTETEKSTIENVTVDGEKCYLFSCPNCDGTVLVAHKEVNCKIFRHAIYKKDGKFIGPHTPKEQCDNLVKQGKVRGCAKPFWFDGKLLKVCGYI